MSSFGIDLGTTNSSIAWLLDGRPCPIAIEGHAIVPSVVLYRGDRVIVGREARNLELQHPEVTIRSVKRRMGQPHRFAVGDREVSPAQVSAEILGALKRGAELATQEEVRDVVITVPAYFDDGQRRATLEAAELAGLNVLRLLNEPTSASLVYDQVSAGPGAAASDEPQMVLVYDLGGGTFDASVIEVFEGVREVRATTGNARLGGDDFDDALVQRFLGELKRTRAVDPRDDARAMARLRRVAEETKIRLSSATEVEVREEFLTRDGRGEPVHLVARVTRRDLESLIDPLLESTIGLARQVVDDARLAGQELGKICLVGGSTRIPRCRALLSEAFPGVAIHEEIDPDLAVALGSSIQAGMLAGAELSRILVDIAAHSLGIRVLGSDDDEEDEDGRPDRFAPVLHRNTVIPAQRTEEFYTIVDDQEMLKVEVFQGESPRVSRNTAVGSFDFPLEPAPEQSPIRVEFAYDLSGVINVSVSQVGTANAKTVALSVADAGSPAQTGHAVTAIERKAEALIEQLDGTARGELEARLAAFRAANGPAREAAEEALLDFFLDHDDDRDGGQSGA